MRFRKRLGIGYVHIYIHWFFVHIIVVHVGKLYTDMNLIIRKNIYSNFTWKRFSESFYFVRLFYFGPEKTLKKLHFGFYTVQLNVVLNLELSKCLRLIPSFRSILQRRSNSVSNSVIIFFIERLRKTVFGALEGTWRG